MHASIMPIQHPTRFHVYWPVATPFVSRPRIHTPTGTHQCLISPKRPTRISAIVMRPFGTSTLAKKGCRFRLRCSTAKEAFRNGPSNGVHLGALASVGNSPAAAFAGTNLRSIRCVSATGPSRSMMQLGTNNNAPAVNSSPPKMHRNFAARIESTKRPDETAPPSSRRHFPRQKPRTTPQNGDVRPIPTSSWICITKTPTLSNLDDALDEIGRVVSIELERGIVELDEVERIVSDETRQESPSLEDLPFWTPAFTDEATNSSDSLLQRSLVQEARLILSGLGRPCGWYLRMPNRSVVHAILRHHDEVRKERTLRPVAIGAKRIELAEYIPPSLNYVGRNPRGLAVWNKFGYEAPVVETSFDRAVRLRVDDSAVRVENCPSNCSADDIRFLFRRYELIDPRKLADDDFLSPVQLLIKGRHPSSGKVAYCKDEPSFLYGNKASRTSTFLVRMQSPADARAIMRDMQTVEFQGRQLRLAQFPKQILRGLD